MGDKFFHPVDPRYRFRYHPNLRREWLVWFYPQRIAKLFPQMRNSLDLSIFPLRWILPQRLQPDDHRHLRRSDQWGREII